MNIALLAASCLMAVFPHLTEHQERKQDLIAAMEHGRLCPNEHLYAFASQTLPDEDLFFTAMKYPACLPSIFQIAMDSIDQMDGDDIVVQAYTKAVENAGLRYLDFYEQEWLSAAEAALARDERPGAFQVSSEDVHTTFRALHSYSQPACEVGMTRTRNTHSVFRSCQIKHRLRSALKSYTHLVLKDPNNNVSFAQRIYLQLCLPFL